MKLNKHVWGLGIILILGVASPIAVADTSLELGTPVGVSFLNNGSEYLSLPVPPQLNNSGKPTYHKKNPVLPQTSENKELNLIIIGSVMTTLSLIIYSIIRHKTYKGW